jgi:serine/threonine protein kinase
MTKISVTEAKTLGDLWGEKIIKKEDAKRIYHQRCTFCHPDVIGKAGEEDFKKLNNAWHLTERLFEEGKYDPATPIDGFVIINTKKHSYTLGLVFQDKSFFTIFYAARSDGIKCLIKTPKDAADNDLVIKERAVYDKLFKTPKEMQKLTEASFLKLIDNFELDGKQINVFEFDEKLESLESIVARWNLDGRTMAWIWRRVLGGLGVLSAAGYVHGAINPKNILIDKESHRGVLFDLSFSVKIGEKVPAIEDGYHDFVHSAIKDKQPVKTFHDTWASAQVAADFCNEFIENNRITHFVRAILMGGYTKPFDIHDEFGKVLELVYGVPKFHPFSENKLK